MISTCLAAAVGTLLSVCSAQRVTLKFGTLQGITLNISDGSTADVFLNIPYAKPPVGELRFEVSWPVGVRELTHSLIETATSRVVERCP